MKTKALLLGALSQPHEGPWVRIDDAEEWLADSRNDYGEHVLIDVKPPNGDPPRSFPLGDGLRISGEAARARIVSEIVSVKVVTVQLTQVR